VGISDGPECVDDRGSFLDGARHLGRIQLDAGDVSVVPHADLGEAETAKGGLGLRDLAETLERDWCSLRDA
jgi:hypothetical protein